MAQGASDKRNKDEFDKEFDKEFDGLKLKWDELEKWLLEIKIFNHLDDDIRLRIVMNLNMINYNDGDIIVNQGKPSAGFFIIVEGGALVTRSLNENESAIRIATLGPKNFFGGKGLFFGVVNDVSVKADGQLVCMEMGADEFNLLIAPVLSTLRTRWEQYQSFFDLFV